MQGIVLLCLLLMIIVDQNADRNDGRVFRNTGTGLETSENPQTGHQTFKPKLPFNSISKTQTSTTRAVTTTVEWAATTTTCSNNSSLPLHSKFDSSKSCYYIPVYMSPCPPGFEHLIHNSENLCYTLTDDQTFPPPCPYPHFLPYHQIEFLLHNYFSNKIIWLHALRNTSSGFPNFEWVESGLLYGQVVSETLKNANDIDDKNCLVFKDENFYRVSCSEKHHSLCMYSVERLQSSKLAKLCKSSEYQKCILSSYDLTSPKCFCKKTDSSKPEKDKFCKALAEPIYPYQTILLKKYFSPDSSKCWFGLYKDVAASVRYKWASTNSEVTYTLWAAHDSCGHREGAYSFAADPLNGWVLAKDKTLQCAICATTLHLEPTTLQLTYNNAKDVIELRVTNLISISKIHDLALYCYSDSNEDDFKQKISFVEHDNLETKNKPAVTVDLRNLAAYPSFYWCDAFEYSSRNAIRSNMIMAHSKLISYGHEFAAWIIVDLPSNLDPFLSKTHTWVCEKIRLHMMVANYQVQSLRPMRGHFVEDHNRMDLLIHVTTRKSSEPIEAQHKKLFSILQSLTEQRPEIQTQYLLSSEVCLPDTTLTLEGEILEWPMTKAGTTAIPANRLCLDEAQDMVPVTRKCDTDFLYGSRWEDPVGTCSVDTTYPETTHQLFDLVNRDAPANDIMDNLALITQENSKQSPINVHLVSVVLERLVAVQDEEVDNQKFSGIISDLMDFNQKILKDAQHLLNSTDRILSSLDDFMNKQNSLMVVSPRLVVQITDLNTTNVTGLALHKTTSKTTNFNSYTFNQLFKDTSFVDLLEDETLETAVLLPPNISKDSSGTKLVIIIFFNDFLFNEPEELNTTQQSPTRIVSVTIPGFTDTLSLPIKMAFQMPTNYLNSKNCSHWNYGLDPLMTSIYGQWSTNQPSSEEALLEICDFFHMTHFGVLLQGRPQEGPHNDLSLVILSAIGSALSLIGIIPIFITAILFKTWRKRAGNIILINFCAAITIQIIMVFSLHATEDGLTCKLLGAGLHYIVLSEFCWMFVVAFLQHRRFVLVFKPQEEDTIVKKCVAIGWGFPLIPVIITLSISPEYYKMNPYGFCTISGNCYYYGYILPIVLILCSNLFFFARIIYSVSRQTVESCAQRSRNYKLEILLGLFLFFALGMTWIFGLIGALGGGVWFTYIFCITATLQGLVLFVFFIAGNKETRLMWKKRSTYYMDRKGRRSGGAQSSNTTIVSSE